MRNLAIDIGNSAIKYAVFAGEQLEQSGKVAALPDLWQITGVNPVDNIIVSSVRATENQLVPQLQAQGNLVLFDYQTPVPVYNHYGTPQTLGMDRLAAVVGANFLYPTADCLVIDAGTCITCDFIDKAQHFWGGSISPGLQMKFRAMHTFTQKLPLIEQAIFPVPLAGTTTQEAMQSGVVNGTIAELNGTIAAYTQKSAHLLVVLCGGDAAFFETKLKAHIFVVPELVLIGLNRILNYNV